MFRYAMDKLILNGKLNLTRTAGIFNQFIKDNKEVFYKYFKVHLFPGSLNVKVDEHRDLQQNLDKGIPSPAFVIPKNELIGMRDYIGNGQAWTCSLFCKKLPEITKCWIFRRIGSKVPSGVIELVAAEQLVKPYSLCDGDSVTIELR